MPGHPVVLEALLESATRLPKRDNSTNLLHISWSLGKTWSRVFQWTHLSWFCHFVYRTMVLELYAESLQHPSCPIGLLPRICLRNSYSLWLCGCPDESLLRWHWTTLAEWRAGGKALCCFHQHRNSQRRAEEYAHDHFDQHGAPRHDVCSFGLSSRRRGPLDWLGVDFEFFLNHKSTGFELRYRPKFP